MRAAGLALIEFVLRAAAWPLRIAGRLALLLLGLAAAVAAVGAFAVHGVSWEPALMAVLAGACFEVRRAVG